MSSPAERMTPFPFFVGCGRSGTTLIRVMLDAHPDMAIPPETYFVSTFGRHRRRYERPWGFDSEKLAGDLLRHRWFRMWQVSEDELRRALTDPSPAGLPDATRRLYEVYAHRRSKSRYGDKTPAYVLSIGLLAELFPEGRFVHVIRDGRDVARSMLDVRFGPETLPEAALVWKTRVGRGRRAGKALGPRRYREVRYEALVEDPEGTLRSLCAFIDLDFEETMLRYHERPDVAQDVGRPQQHRSLSLPPTKGLRDWKRDLKGEDLEVFEALAGDLLTRLGYERACPKPSLSSRVSARKWEAMNAAQRVRGRLRKFARPVLRGPLVESSRRIEQETGAPR